MRTVAEVFVVLAAGALAACGSSSLTSTDAGADSGADATSGDAQAQDGGAPPLGFDAGATCRVMTCDGAVDLANGQAIAIGNDCGDTCSCACSNGACSASCTQGAACACVDGGFRRANGACDPPCAAGQYCYAVVMEGGGKRPVDPADAAADASADSGTLGCNPIPTACAADAGCGCLADHVRASCQASFLDCVVDDAGRPTVQCVTQVP